MKLAFMGALSLVVASAHAVVLYTENFDSYASGTDLHNVSGWQTQSGPNPPAAGSAFVQSGSPGAQSGSNYARVNQAVGTGSNTFRVLYRNMGPAWSSRPGGSDNVLITGWIYVPTTTTASFNFEQQMSGMSAIGIRRNSPTELAGYIGGSTTANVNFNTNHWNQLQIFIGRTTGNAEFFLNGSSMGTIGGVGMGNNPGFLGILNFVPSGSGLTGPIYADSLRYEAVPEPATMAALGLGVAALIRRRKAKKA